MDTSVELERAVRSARRALDANEQGDLRPVFRQAIYGALGPLTTVQGKCRRVCLGISCVEHVLPIWSRERPDDDWPERLLQLAVQCCRGVATRSTADPEVSKAWFWSTNEYQDRSVEVPINVLDVLDAARETVIVGLEWDQFAGLALDESTTDCDLDHYTKDPAVHASRALAGSTLHPTASEQVRRDYWLWWLTDAVPNAWNEGMNLPNQA